jgi:hypothetical protein
MRVSTIHNITTKYDQIFHAFSLLLRHLFVALATKSGFIFRGYFFVAIYTKKNSSWKYPRKMYATCHSFVFLNNFYFFFFTNIYIATNICGKTQMISICCSNSFYFLFFTNIHLYSDKHLSI